MSHVGEKGVAGDTGRRGKIAGLLLTVLTGFVGGLLLHEPFTRFTCGLMSPGVSAKVTFYCRDEFRRVDVEAATREFDAFLERASGPRPGSAWSELGTEAQADRALPEFLDGWSDVYWAERLGPTIEVDGFFNRFSVRFRVFRGSSDEEIFPAVYSRDRVFQVKYDEGTTQITDLDPPGRPTLDRLTIPDVTTIGPATSYGLPTTAGPGDGAGMRAGRSVPVLCRIEMPDGWWGYAPSGWLREDDLVGGAAAFAAASLCNPHHAEEASDVSGL